MSGISKGMMLGLLILVCMLGMVLVQIGIVSYENQLVVSERQYEIRTPAEYIYHKIKAQDKAYPIEIRNQEDKQILVLTNEEGGSLYETWIYALEHSLYEIYVPAGSKVDLRSGFKLMEIENLCFDLDDTRLVVSIKPENAKCYKLLFDR